MIFLEKNANIQKDQMHLNPTCFLYNKALSTQQKVLKVTVGRKN